MPSVSTYSVGCLTAYLDRAPALFLLARTLATVTATPSFIFNTIFLLLLLLK